MKFAIALIAAFTLAEANQFKSGAVTGYEKFTYGKFITRMKAPNKKGTVSSFFTYWNGPDFYPGGWNELDVEIVPSVEQNPFSMNVIYGDGHTKRETHDYMAGFNPKDEWHIYELAWTPEFISWSIDHKEVRRIKSDDPSVKLTNKGQSVMMNFWTPTFDSWGAGLDAKDMPWEVVYDFVETYTYNQDKKTFEFNWKDNFDTFDTNRWHKSDNTTFDANSTTFRASQVYIGEGNLHLKMEPDHPENVHGVHRFDAPKVESVKTEPTPSHAMMKGEKARKGDEHFDVGAEQHFSHERRAVHQAYDPYAYGPQHPYYGQEAYGGPHAYNPFGVYEETPYHYQPNPYHHEQPPKTKAEAEQHMGPEAALFYKEMHEKAQQQQQQQQPKQQGKQATQPAQKKQQQRANDAEDNFATYGGIHYEQEETPFEYEHPLEQHEMKQLTRGYEHHPDAHFEQGYWDLKDHQPHLYDHGHFAGEEHGEYHYVEPERDGHMGHYYSYRDDREHHPQHADYHHDHHGIEHRPDDWRHEHHTYYKHHDTYGHAPEHGYEGDFELGGDFHSLHDPNLNHDVHFHQGTGMMHEMEHQFDELFHDMEHHTHHGVEHHDIHFTELDKADLHPQEHETDFHGEVDHSIQHHAIQHEELVDHQIHDLEFAREHHGVEGRHVVEGDIPFEPYHKESGSKAKLVQKLLSQ